MRDVADKLPVHEAALDRSGQPGALFIGNAWAVCGAKGDTEELQRIVDEGIAIRRENLAACETAERQCPIALDRGACRRDHIAERGEIGSAPQNWRTSRPEWLLERRGPRQVDGADRRSAKPNSGSGHAGGCPICAKAAQNFGSRAKEQVIRRNQRLQRNRTESAVANQSGIWRASGAPRCARNRRSSPECRPGASTARKGR